MPLKAVPATLTSRGLIGMDCKDLQGKWKEAIAARRHADALANEYDMLLNRLRASKCVPPGYDIDVLGDGKIKKIESCAKHLKLSDEDEE